MYTFSYTFGLFFFLSFLNNCSICVCCTWKDLPIRNMKNKNKCQWFPLITTKQHTLNKFLGFLQSSWHWWHSQNLCCVSCLRGYTWRSTVAYFMDVLKHAIFLVSWFYMPSCEFANNGLVESVQLICPFVQSCVASPSSLLVVQF